MVVVLITLPSMVLPSTGPDAAQIVALVAIFGALFTLVEYSASSPSLVEFRDAPPFNRVRFSMLFASVLSLSMILRDYVDPSGLTAFFRQSSVALGEVLASQYSPFRLMLAVMPEADNALVAEQLRNAAGFSYIMSLWSVIWFVVLLQLQRWPRIGGPFNVWVNLPTFDPTSGGDVVKRLKRDGRINVFLGFLLPFLIPIVIKSSAFLGAPFRFDDPQTMIWTVTAWTFLPAGMLMRGIALVRIANMIKRQRKRAYERAASEDMLLA